MSNDGKLPDASGRAVVRGARAFALFALAAGAVLGGFYSAAGPSPEAADATASATAAPPTIGAAPAAGGVAGAPAGPGSSAPASPSAPGSLPASAPSAPTTSPAGPAATATAAPTPAAPGASAPPTAPGVPALEAPTEPHGSLPREVVQSTVREAMPFLRFCFEWQLERHPELAGRVTMSWTIREDGTVADADVLEDALGDDTVLRCFRGVVGRLEFPPPEGGEVTVHYPFVLAGAPEAREPEGI